MYVSFRFYVGCDLCKNWFHGRCVGISSEDAHAMNEFVCMECNQKQKTVEEEELYCICRQPYDETKYVSSEVFEVWFALLNFL